MMYPILKFWNQLNDCPQPGTLGKISLRRSSVPDSPVARTGQFPFVVTWFALLLAWGVVGWAQDEQGASQASIVELDFTRVTQLLEKSVADKAIAGAVAMVTVEGRTEYSAALGEQNAELNIPMSTKTIFRLASMTKPITSAAVMMLVEEGKLRLDQPVSEILPSFKSLRVLSIGQPESEATLVATPITIAHMLSHTSGFTYPFFVPPPHVDIAERLGICSGVTESSLNVIENAERISQWPLVTAPGTSWQYGLSTDVLGAVVEKASGMPFDTFLETRLFQPLSMHDSSFVLPLDKQNRFASLYRPNADKRIEPALAGKNIHGSIVYSSTFQMPDASIYRSGGAGLVSTAEDYSHFLAMLLGRGEYQGKRLLKPETVAAMTANQIGDLSIGFPIHGNKFGYGFGVHTSESDRMGASIGTYSWGGMFHTYFWVDPEQKVIGILMTQLFPFDHLTLWADFQRTTYQVLHNPRK